jgi:two-component system chemotaxis response regulator CheB
VVQPPRPIVLRKPSAALPRIIAIGSSTGGPQALLEVLRDMAASVKLPILITQHMPATFTTLLAEHIERATGVPCAEGKDGETITGGRIYLAPGNFHMMVERAGAGSVIRLNQNPPENFCRPSVDPMLRSMAPLYGASLLTIILTGMGSDGQKGAAEVVQAGGTVIAQDEATSVVWGMPGAVATSGLCSAVLPIKEIGPSVRKLVMRSAA